MAGRKKILPLVFIGVAIVALGGAGMAMWRGDFVEVLLWMNLVTANLLLIRLLRPLREPKKIVSMVAIMFIGFGATLLAYQGFEMVGLVLFLLVLAGIVGIDKIWPRRRGEVVQITSKGVERFAGDLHEKIQWEELVEVGIMTTSDGTLAKDFFWLLFADDGTGCVVSEEDAKELLPVLQRLPDFDIGAVLDAMASTEKTTHTVWQGARGSAAEIGELFVQN